MHTRQSFIFILILFLAVVSVDLTVSAQQDYSNEVIVYFTSGVRRMAQTNHAKLDAADIKSILQKYNVQSQDVISAFPDFIESDTVKNMPDGRKIGQPNLAKVFKIRTTNNSSMDALIEELKKLPSVLFAEPNGKAKFFTVPNDPYFGNQWNMHNTGQYGGTVDADIDAPEAWSIFTGSTNCKIGIIDDGVDYGNLDLYGKSSGDGASGNHGTHVAGIAAAITDNNRGVAGVDWYAQIISKSIAYSDEVGICSKIQSAVDEQADVLNNSWGLIDTYGNPKYSTIVRLSFAYAYKHNCIAVAAMGNEGMPLVNYPAGFGQGIIAVGATDIYDYPAFYTTTGNHIDVSAPGGDGEEDHQIYSTIPGNTYGHMAGTSMSTPHVAGLASLLKGYRSSLSNDDIEHIIQLSADDLHLEMYPAGWDEYYGYGRINAYKALKRLSDPYKLYQFYAIGGLDQGASNQYQMTIYGAQGLSDGLYKVKRHEVRKAITYPVTSNVIVWGRGYSTIGWANEGIVNFTYGFCEPVPGTVTATSATLRTCVYEVFDLNNVFIGWYPVAPNNVRFEYTVHGIPAIITTNTIWEGNYYLDCDVTVNSGATLSIAAGSTIHFRNVTVNSGATLSIAAGSTIRIRDDYDDDGAIISTNMNIYGKLLVNGTDSQPVTIISINGGSWGSINFNGAGTEHSVVEYADIQKGTEIFVSNVANYGVSVRHCNMENMVNGIHYYNAWGWVENNTITDPLQHGILITDGSRVACYWNKITKSYSSVSFGIYYGGGSWDYIWGNEISGFYFGLGARWGSSPTLGHYSNTGQNNHITNCNMGLNIYMDSYPTIGYPLGDEGCERTYGNSVHDNSTWAAYIVDCPDRIIMANNVYWGTTDPAVLPTLFYLSNVYNFDYSNPLPSCTWPHGLGKIASISGPSGQPSGSTPQNPVSIQSGSDDVLSPGVKLRLQGKYEEAKEYFKSVIKKNPEKTAAYIELYETVNDTTSSDILNFFAALPAKAPPAAKILLSNLYLRGGNIESAKHVNNEIVNQHPTSNVAIKAQLNNFYIALYNEGNQEQAGKILSEISCKPAASEDIELTLAQQVLKIYKGDKLERGLQQQASKEAVASIPVKFEFSQNYPNPFNPVTTIRYELPVSGYVKLKVYDMLGREVATLADDMKNAGYHTVEFNGSNMTSGVYFTRLTIRSEEGKVFTQTRKMLLAK